MILLAFKSFKTDIHTQNVFNLFKKQNSIKTNVAQVSYKMVHLTSETKPLGRSYNY